MTVSMDEKTRLALFEQTIVPHLNAAYNLAAWLTRNNDDAEDVVQEAYLRAFRFFGGFHGGDGKAWLLTIVRNTCQTWLRREKGNRSVVMFDEQTLSSHLRSLMGTHLLDAPSTDQHTVKPWFNGKLSFSPDVKDFSSQGFRLVGGRIEYLADQPVAALVYQRRQHFINLFTWPSSSPSQNGYSEMKRSGYNLVSWTEDGMTCWAVSDLETGELEQFAQLYK